MLTLRRSPAAPAITDPNDLARELGTGRALDAARRDDELARVRAAAGHDRARADVAEEARLAELARAEREADAAAEVELARMFRTFRASGERTRIKSMLARSGEARALSLERLRVLNLKILIPLLIGCGIWSTTGVQQGASRIMGVTTHSPVWWVLWGLEALLIGTVCWIIIVRARLAAAGGRLDPAAERVGIGALTVSIFLNLVAAVPTEGVPAAGWWAIPGSMFAHAIGPVGAAVIAHLIGTIDKSITDADPWTDEKGAEVPRLADMDLRSPAVTAPTNVPAAAEDVADQAWPESASEESAETPRTVDEQREERPSEAPQGAADELDIWDWHPPARRPFRTQRPNKGVPVPEILKRAADLPPSVATDEALAWRLYDMVAAGEVDGPDGVPSIRATQTALSLGFDRAKTVRALYRTLRRTLPEHARLEGVSGRVNGAVRQ